ncbi:MAG: hypothetical protein GY722_27240 [bacterium]|nr:hypothetical protein [bacterium]
MSLHRSVLTLALFLSIGTGCHESDDVMTPPSQTVTVELHYDGDNATAPNLPAATYKAAARFTTAQTGDVAGGDLVEILFFIQSVPDNCQVNVYGPGTADSPGALLYAEDVTAGILANDWNSHVLPNPVAIPNGDLWITIEFTHATSLRVIGCDAGPVVPDGDWLFSSADATWLPFNQRFSASINWNIRGIAEVTR